jgi:putative restriction endonuclease
MLPFPLPLKSQPATETTLESRLPLLTSQLHADPIMLSTREFLRRVDAINVWARRGIRAPHKPLLLLLALGRFSAGIPELPFAECNALLKLLLREFGPSRASLHPEYPFWRLQKDNLWVVYPQEGYTTRISNDDPTVSSLLSAKAVGRFPPDIEELLNSKPRLATDTAQALLSRHFPQSLHADILNAVDISPDFIGIRSQHRPQGFRRDVLAAYQYACAVCGFALRINDTTIGLDAAHIMWRQANGPDVPSNGIALCILHHRLFDIGAFTLSSDMRVLVSDRVSGGDHLHRTLTTHHGCRLTRPVRPEHLPLGRYIDWHRRQVFKELPLPT